MKRKSILKVALVTMLFVIPMVSLGQKGGGSKIADTKLVKLKDLKITLDKVVRELASRDYPLKATEAKIVFETSNDRTFSGEVGILVVKAGYERTAGKSSEISYTFDLTDGQKGVNSNIETELVKTVNSAFAQLLEANAPNVTELTVTVAFTIGKNKTVGANVDWDFLPLSLGADGTWENKAVHTIEITFKR